MSEPSIVFAVDEHGEVSYYTGKPGDQFVSERRADAKEFPTTEGAQAIVQRLNGQSAVHHRVFIWAPVSVNR